MADDNQASIDKEDQEVENDYAGVLISPRKVYTKDVSFETPNSPEIFMEDWDPSVSVDAATGTREMGDDFHEVVLALTVTASLGDKTAYLAEVHQAGLFLFRGLEPGLMDRTINVFCMRFLYPYATATLLDLISRGEFPQILLPPMYFAKRYKQRMLESQSENKTTDTEAS